ncbi:hypothetical protein Q4524_06675 [Alteromonas stellipolaris]|uniref:Uncharacterized protein n=1 Tax=Alteromonas stellipolaris TaxID=233316 RepID=A0AAW7YZP9_9ALTE|nr:MULTISPECIES: hypothetical protein [Alteromonas]AMJ92488.1 hypothetical protein AV940_19545 [Alteromonas sp. Mac2]AMJ88632.1 hypothetical protein AV939_19850 [Alteromonas sp. Mac1]ANB25477.1 hypothetical protein A6F57_09835 [Alteromonas stellipolaris]MDO6538260.1 hypothetical protein [Alteromonas stellipolaris]MDO6576678.1 hypothetical protein [Alteromonas stellipolaris]
MKVAPPTSKPQQFIGLFPLLVLLAIPLLNMYSGAFYWPDSGDMVAQRSFNSAVSISLFIGYFWFSFRYIHQNVASSLISLLVKKNQLGQFSVHRQKLTKAFHHQIVNSLIISSMFMAVLAFLGDVSNESYNIKGISYIASFVTFSLLTSLFLFQVRSNVTYLLRQVLPGTNKSSDYWASFSVITKLSLTNALFALGLLTVLPIFWFNVVVSPLEVIAVVSMSLLIVAYTFTPLLKLKLILKQQKTRTLNQGQSVTNNHNRDDRQPKVVRAPSEVCNSSDKLKTIAALILVPVSWGLVSMVETLI